MTNSAQTDPLLPVALAALRKCGYSVGQSTVSAEGHTMVTVAGRVMTQEEIFKLAGMQMSGK